MRELELVLGLFVAGVILAAAARRVGALSSIPGGRRCAAGVSSRRVLVQHPLELALALFVAPVLLDAAYDASQPFIVTLCGLLFYRAALRHTGLDRIDTAIAPPVAILRTNSSEKDANFDCPIAIQKHLEMPGRR